MPIPIIILLLLILVLAFRGAKSLERFLYYNLKCKAIKVIGLFG